MQKIELTDVERAPIDGIGATLARLDEQRAGMIAYIAHLKGVKDSGVEYKDGALLITPREVKP